MVYEERTMKSEKLYEGKILSLRVDTVEIPNKMYSKREIIEHPGSVAIVTIVDEDKLVLVKQYRKAVEDFILEIPAGKIEVNEEPKEKKPSSRHWLPSSAKSSRKRKSKAGPKP